jgi:hypothetical protein
MDARHSYFRFWSVLAFVAAVFAAGIGAAHAQDASPEVLAKVTRLNKKALDAYAKRDYEAARTALKEALDICANSGLDSHPIKARTHIHLGAVLIGGFKQREAGIKHFKKALQIQPDIQLTKSIATPPLQDAFEEAMVASAPAGGAGGDDPERNQPAQSSGDDQTPPANADGDEAPTRRRTAVKAIKRKKRHSGDDDDGDDEKKGDDDDDEGPSGGNNAGRIFVGLTGGSGMGWASGTGEMSSKHVLAQGGFALAQAAHVSPEVGYFFSSSLLLSLQLRYQIITGLNPGPNTCTPSPCTPSSSAIAVMARATMFFGDGDAHFFVGGAVGGGTIRHVSNFPADASCAPNPGMTSCVDTLKAGPFLIGPSAGLFYDLGKTASLILAVNTEVGVPNFTFNVDVNGGVGLRF